MRLFDGAGETGEIAAAMPRVPRFWNDGADADADLYDGGGIDGERGLLFGRIAAVCQLVFP